MSNKIEREIIKRRGKFPHVPGLDQEFDNLISQINKKEPTTIINNNVNEGVEIDDTQEFGVTDKTYSSFKINDELANIPIIKEYYEAFGLECLELPDGESGKVYDRNITCMWDDVRVKDVSYFADLPICKNGYTGERDFVLTKDIAKKIMDYGVFFYVTYDKTPPPNMFPVNPPNTPENEGWFFWGYTNGNRAVIKCPYESQIWVWVFFRQKNTDYFSGVANSGIIQRKFKYLS